MYYFTHDKLDSIVREMASKVISAIPQDLKPEFYLLIFKELCASTMALKESVTTLQSCLEKIESFLVLWIQKRLEIPLAVVRAAEAVAVVFLCCPNAPARVVSLSILSKSALVNCPVDSCTYVQSVVTELGQELLRRIGTRGMTIDRLARATSRPEQFFWSLFLAEFAPIASYAASNPSLLVPSAMELACAALHKRFNRLAVSEASPSLLTSTIDAETEYKIFWWRNRAVVLTSAGVFDSAQLTQLFHHILPGLKASRDLVREACILALDRASAQGIEALVKAIEPYERRGTRWESLWEAGPVLHRERVRSDCALLRMTLLQNVGPRCLGNPAIRADFISYIQEDASHFSLPDNDTVWSHEYHR